MRSKTNLLTIPVVLLLGLVLTASFGISSFSEGENRLLSEEHLLNCRRHAYLYRSAEDYTAPPNKTCSNRYKGHLYYVAEIAGEPVSISEIVASVRGGPVDLEEEVEGFKLEVLPRVSFENTGEKGKWSPTEESTKVLLGLLSEDEAWKTLVTFSVPCSMEEKKEISWEGKPVEIVAVRVVAPRKHTVEYTELGPKGGGNELKESGGWMKIMSAPGHADYVKN